MISFLKNGNLLYRTMKKVLFVIPHPDDEIVGSCILIKDFLTFSDEMIENCADYEFDKKNQNRKLHDCFNPVFRPPL